MWPVALGGLERGVLTEERVGEVRRGAQGDVFRPSARGGPGERESGAESRAPSVSVPSAPIPS